MTALRSTGREVWVISLEAIRQYMMESFNSSIARNTFAPISAKYNSRFKVDTLLRNFTTWESKSWDVTLVKSAKMMKLLQELQSIWWRCRLMQVFLKLHKARMSLSSLALTILTIAFLYRESPRIQTTSSSLARWESKIHCSMSSVYMKNRTPSSKRVIETISSTSKLAPMSPSRSESTFRFTSALKTRNQSTQWKCTTC